MPIQEVSNKCITMARIDIEQHRALQSENYLTIKEHGDLLIHNYTNKAQYDQKWTRETRQSRGLITTTDGTIVARPFEKFFNLNEHISIVGPLPEDEPFEVYEKLDGSLGILYHFDGVPMIATRGSFTSDQANVANRILKEKYSHIVFDPQITYLFEIIYPGNKIVVDYEDTTDLVLLAMIDISTGEELPLSDFDLDMPVVKRVDQFKDLESLLENQKEPRFQNKEGYVVRFLNGLRVKVKYEQYVLIHRLRFKASWKNVLEALREGNDVADPDLPDELFEEVKKVEKELVDMYHHIKSVCESQYREFPTMKEAALYFNKECDYPRVMFSMMKKRDDIDKNIWSIVEASKKESETTEN